ncbi:hypothetical protein [Streptomyces roseolilacinus]|uniref:Uncharacterized protein n=1 Tax=Streptomyces roseolilacinus TaxID=66904 RepID=A0A918ELS5_9ACTN|nr:hypothetical protein [Streptomyces roseolilacinus]GGQ24396.1 hypothetical protein GCM10010249_48820 [Streptomyces roseolilacinus]
MPARTPTRTHATGGGAAAGTGGVRARLPWWAVAPPVAAFTALFLLLTAPGQAPGAGAEPAVGRIVDQLRHTLTP